MAIRRLLPEIIASKLWGNRRKFGLKPNINDSDWKKWLENRYSDFYQNTQQKGVGDRICKLAYPVISRINFTDARVLEIGPGIIRHLDFMKSVPQKYTICDTEIKCLSMSKEVLDDAGIPNETFLMNENNWHLPFANDYFDVVITFHSLEHLFPLNVHLKETCRVIKVGGQIAGGIPCEGGLAWGMGRFITTRRYARKVYNIDYDKIICWEHPNFAEFILQSLSNLFKFEYVSLHPFRFLPIDFNLIASFIFRKEVL